MAVEPPTVPELGLWTEVDIRAVREWAGGFTNRPGIPDTKEGIRTRVNASYARFDVELWVCLNEILAGRKIVPGIPDSGTSYQLGRAWRPGDDQANVVSFADLTLYTIPVPGVLWGLNSERTSESGADVIDVNSTDSNRVLWSLVNHRGGTSDASAGIQTFGLRGTGGFSYYADAAVTGMSTPGELTVCATFGLPQWNQANNGVVLLAHRLWNSDDEETTAGNLGFELGLGDPNGANGNDLALYYRGRDPQQAEQLEFATVGTGSSEGRVYLPWNREHHIAFQRYDAGGGDWHVRFVLNGIELSDVSIGQEPTPGTSSDMRIIFGSDWDGLKHMGGHIRNVMVWPSGTTQPTVGHLQTIYRVGAGFSNKAP